MTRSRISAFPVAILLACVPFAALAQAQGEGALWENPHTRYVKRYEGTKTCLQCHEAEARQVFSSVHYQWQAAAPNLLNARGRSLGKINTMNDFCTNPTVNWIGILQNAAGQVIGNGCSKCHAGLGLQPTAQLSRDQLENIDCLICHAPSYRREVVRQEDGTLRWAPSARDNPDLMLNVVQHVAPPTNGLCLRCHLGAGGGMNYKRGDLEAPMANPGREFDVHMGSAMQCIQCHRFRDHRVRGAGTQMAGTDLPDDRAPRCAGCHRGELHQESILDGHTKAVACTTCHIPFFARQNPTDMRRDWSHAEPVAGEGRYEPAIEFRQNVVPVYAWWNGTGSIALFDEPVRRNANGRVSMYAPAGGHDDSAAKIHAFKYHTAKLPVEKATGLMIPVQVGPVFRDGDVARGVKNGAAAHPGRDLDPARDVEWVETERYLGLFHGVPPAAAALHCADCHAPGGRLNWRALGYPGDPAQVGGRRPAAAATPE